MPAYLTHAAVVIKMTEWLELLRARIDDRRKLFAAAGKPTIALDDRLDFLAGRTLDYLREIPSASGDAALPVTNIKNGVGTRISKYAFVGSLGPDLPAAGYVLAMNQDWAWHTLHNGEPRRARKNARSTTFILKLLEILERDEKDRKLTQSQRRFMVSYALGHLAHIAADVVLHPAVHHLTWDKDRGPLNPLEHKLFEVAIDAQLAHGFYKREDLYDNIQSWDNYYLDDGDDEKNLNVLWGALSSAFKATYGDERPNAPVCGLADPSKCGAPSFDAKFLMDGYRNTTNWAIDAGYDHAPLPYDIFWTLLVAGSAIWSALSLASGTKSFGTITNAIFDANQEAVDELTAEAAAEWQEKGTANIEVWREIIDKSFGAIDKVATPVEWLLGGGKAMCIITFGQASDGFFGQHDGVEDSNPAIRDINKAVWTIKTLGFIALDEIVPKFTEEKAWTWLWFALDIMHDLFEHFALTFESRKDNYSEERLDNATWGPKKIVGVSNFIGNAAMMLLKSRKDDNEPRPSGVQGVDIVFPLIATALTSAIFIFGGFWRDHLLVKTTKSQWPSKDTTPVWPLLPLAPDGRSFSNTEFVQKTGVRLFPDAALTTEGTELYYPDGGGAASDVDGQTTRDRDARETALKEFAGPEYKFTELVDHAARFAGLLGMSAVAYSESTAAVRPHLTAIFKDWNLDFGVVSQWKELMHDSKDADMGLLDAALKYTTDLEAKTDAPDLIVIDRLRSALGVTDIAGGFFADFGREGIALDSVAAETARGLRLTRPGAVLLPNVDVDTPAPSPLPATLPPRTGDLDALRNDTINPDGNDLAELTQFRIRKPAAAGSPHTLTLRLHADDASRVRVFAKNAGTPDTWPVVLGFTSAGVKLDFEIPAAAPNETDYFIELKAFAGDPGFRTPAGPGPLSPAPFGLGGAAVGGPVVPERRPGEVWIEVVHKDAGVEMPGIRDVGLFSASPLLLVDNLQKAERFYVVFARDQFDSAGTNRRPGNFPFVSDIVRALQSDPLIAPRITFKTRPAARGTLDEFVPHRPVRRGDADEAAGLYLIDGSVYARNIVTGVPAIPSIFSHDRWVQDEFEICYAQGSPAWIPVILHNPRKGQLADFVEKELPAEDVGLFNGVSADADSINFGGNLEVSPAVPTATVLQPRGPAGADVPAQPASPLGKILLGEGTPFLFDIPERFGAELQSRTVSAALVTEMGSHNIRVTTTDTVDVITADREWLLNTPFPRQTLSIRREPGKLTVHLARLTTKEFKQFLEAQRAQPVVTVDTSWLSVGHVDEIFIFVPALRGIGKKFRLFMASSKLGVDLLQEAQFINAADPVAHPLTNSFRGQSWLAPRTGRATATASETVATTLTTHGPFNRELQIRRLTPIEERLKATLALDAADVVRIPVLYDVIPLAMLGQMGATVVDATAPGGFRELRTAAYTPCAVNLQIFDNHALIPKPHGPRMKRDDVIKVLEKVGLPSAVASEVPAVGNEQWARAGTTATSLAATFGSSAAAIRADAHNAGKFSGAGVVTKNWDRIFIPDDRVDLFEGFMHAVLKDLGMQAHFIEEWTEYHILEGEVHCGTNVRRKPAEVEVGYSGPKWWDCASVKG